jgi:hypothetical protein
VNIIFSRTVGGVLRTYQAKSNSIESLVRTITSPSTCHAQFVSKANLTDITDPLNPVSLGGNLQFQMMLHDNGEPGSSDTIGYTLWNGSQLLFSSRWTGVATAEQVLGGGNLQVR